MKASELRIGNWMHFDNMIGMSYDYQVTPRMFRQLGMDLSENIDIELNKYHKPIPLTEEWLLKFGFEKDVEDFYLDIDTALFVSYNDDEFVHLKSNNLEKIISIKYVHQLQNLYFALTGEELTLSE